jgi:hypothetical protein
VAAFIWDWPVLRAAISAVRSMRYCSIGAVFGQGVVASCAIAWYAVPSTTSSAKLLIAIAPTFFFRIVFLLRMGIERIWLPPRDSNPDMLIQSPLTATDSKELQQLPSASSGKVLQNPQPRRNHKAGDRSR